MAADYVPPSRERLLELADELYRLDHTNDGYTVRTGPQQLTKVPAVFATARHAIETGKAAADLIESGKELVAMTLVRSALECAITALWLVQNPEAIFGFVSEDIRARRALSREMAKSASATFRYGAGSIAHVDDETIETIAAPQARYFQRLCDALHHGRDAYLHYRMLSGLVHPCATLTDHYLEPDENAPAGVTFRFEPDDIGHDAWLFLNVACMMWAQRAIDHLDARNLHRSRLRVIARELGVPQTLELTPQAEQAVLRQQQERRRQNRRRRRGK